MNPTIEKGTDMNKSFADLNRRVQRTINSLKISEEEMLLVNKMLLKASTLHTA